MKKYLITLSALATASALSAETYTYVKDGFVLENQTIQNTLLWQGGGVNGTGNIYVKGENTVLASDGYAGFKISGTGGTNCDVNFVFDDGASVSFAKNAMDFNSYYTDISYSVANEGASAKIILQTNQDIATSTDPNDATDTRTVTIGKGITVESSSIWVKADATNTTSKFIVNGAINSSNTFGSTGRAIWEINGSLTAVNDFSDNADEGGAQITVDNGGSINLRNMVLRSGSSFNLKNGTATLNRLSTEAGTDSTLSIESNGKLNVATDISLSEYTNLTIAGEVKTETFTTTSGGASSITIEETGSLTTTGALTFKEGVTAVINGKLNVGGQMLWDKTTVGPNVSIGSTADITLGQLRTRSTALKLVDGSKMTINNTSSSTTSYINAGASVVEKGGTLIINTTNNNTKVIDNHYSLTIEGRFEAHGGKYIATAASGITFNSNDVVLNTNLALGNSADLFGGKFFVGKGITLDAKNATLLQSIQTKKGTTTKAASNFFIYENASAYLKGIGFEQSDEDLVLNINLSKGAKLILTDFVSNGGLDNYTSMDAGDKIVINGFSEKAFGIVNYTNADDNYLSQIIVNGAEQLYWVKDNIAGVWWLSAVAPAVPEPAEWAMILGSLALGLAIYRRRK
ncbi:MAG: hypothetical protein E7036_03595 [Opitutales bacterium]|nr:hypothetical protein [Opitutales bacterium]